MRDVYFSIDEEALELCDIEKDPSSAFKQYMLVLF